MNDYDTLWKEHKSLEDKLDITQQAFQELGKDFSDLLDAANSLTFSRQGSDSYAEAEKVVGKLKKEYGSIE